jgi:glycosyltransferase involved in cell wall biosynthesis
VRQVIGREAPDLIHAGPIQSAAFLAATAGFHPLLSMSWGSDLLLDARGGMGRITARWTLERSDAFACDCQAVRRQAERLGAPEDDIFVFPWGVDLDHFRPSSDSSVRQARGWSNEEVVLISTRAWEPLYGVVELVDGFLATAADWPGLRLIMLGEGSLEPEINKKLAGSRFGQRVFCPGQVQYRDLPAYYRAADLYLSASHSDGSSVSLMEAMACGLPALVSDIPGNQEWVISGQNGWHFPVGDSKGLASAIQSAMEHRSRFQTMGSNSREIAEARADWPKNFEVLMEAYQAAGQVTA